MKVFLNERSIPEKARNAEEIYSVLSELIVLAAESKKISNNQQIQRHRELKNREVLPGKTLIEFINELGNHSDPQKRKVKALLLELFAKAPFLVGFHNEEQHINDTQGNCLKGSCFDDASACRTGAAVISAPVTDEFKPPYLSIESSIFGQRQILNITTRDQLQKTLWVYEINDKHEIPKDIVVEGETYSAMQLSKEEAQQVLSNGIKIGKCIFNKLGSQWYKFHCHDRNIYHGFPVNIRTPYKEFSAARILFDDIGTNQNGQLLEELLEFRART